MPVTHPMLPPSRYPSPFLVITQHPSPLAAGPLAAEMLANYEAGHVCWDDHDTIGGKPTGVVRASFGYASTLEDAEAIGERLVRCMHGAPRHTPRCR